MDKVRFDQILERCNDQEKITLTVLYNAVGKALKQVNANNTGASINDWRKAESAYEDTGAKLWAKYFEPTLPNILAVVDHLTRAGWKVAKSTCYNHRKAGLLRPESDGAFKISTVEKYASEHLTRIDGRPEDDSERLAEDKQRAETRKAKAQAEHWELKTKIAQGLYVPKDAFERELAQRAIVFKADAEAFCRGQAGIIIAMTGGDKDKTPDLIEYMLAAVAGWLNRYAADREFTIPVQVPGPALADPDDDQDEAADD